jgi:hypothetical protein
MSARMRASARRTFCREQGGVRVRLCLIFSLASRPHWLGGCYAIRLQRPTSQARQLSDQRTIAGMSCGHGLLFSPRRSIVRGGAAGRVQAEEGDYIGGPNHEAPRAKLQHRYGEVTAATTRVGGIHTETEHVGSGRERGRCVLTRKGNNLAGRPAGSAHRDRPACGRGGR